MQAIITFDETLPIQRDPQIMSGALVFTGTRVPIQTLFDYLADGCSVTEFLDQFPTVRPDQVQQVLALGATEFGSLVRS